VDGGGGPAGAVAAAGAVTEDRRAVRRREFPGRIDYSHISNALFISRTRFSVSRVPEGC
jgi:hypothetical protein